ncbi:hypothetical protein [Actinoplanes sp. NPDC049599]|uniref:hypothetical protein n=1 Tax=Actinoplanes sp. NPDC049599 TaxID=3363903 RepID=UPI0037BAA1B1
MTESGAPSTNGKRPRRRAMAAVAVLAAVIVLAAGFLINEYRSPAGEPVAATQGAPSPGLGSPVPTLSAPGSAAPSSSVPSSSAKAPQASLGKTTLDAAGGFPGPGNTGVPSGTQLSAYSGPCTVTRNGFEVTGKIINCDPFMIRAQGVVIRKSLVKGTLTTTEATEFSFTLEDSEVSAGMWQGPAVLSTNMTIRRSNIHGGATAVTCAANCDIRDSWLHGQLIPDNVDWHLGGFLANDTGDGGRSNVTLIHNTIACDAKSNNSGGGCSGNINLFADFGPVSGVTIRNNLLGANPDISYCLYGGATAGKAHTSGVRDIVVEDNVFQRGRNGKCGGYGPVTSFNSGLPGNRWKNNTWQDDGKPVAPAN